MPDYSKGKIYKLWSPDLPEDMIYIGSTINELYKRLYEHRSPNNRSSSSYIFINSDNVKIELIENYPCSDKKELNRREGEWIRQLKCVNKVVAGRTSKEYYEHNKDKIKEWREQNKDKIRQSKKEYCEQNKNKIKEYYEHNKDKIKEYRKQNKDKRKEYLAQNKDKIKEQKKTMA